MGKKLAIKGHESRGKEVIELLKMMCGCTPVETYGLFDNRCYLIKDNGWIGWDYIGPEESNEYDIFTLEEFLEKYPFQVGDIADRTIDYVSCFIDKMRWNSEKCCVEYHLNSLNNGKYGWHVSECLIKPENEDVTIRTKIESTGFMQMGKTVSVIFNSENYEDEVELQLGDYEIEVRDGKTYAVKKKAKYPTTYEECYDEDNTELHFIYVDKNERDLYESFIQLIRCRNAYWKIAGEQMGLDKPWEPEWTNEEQEKYCICYGDGNIQKSTWRIYNSILAFPTEEMRDSFYNNFKCLIEQCKELL